MTKFRVIDGQGPPPSLEQVLEDAKNSGRFDNSQDSAFTLVKEDTLGLIGGKLRKSALSGEIYIDDKRLSESQFTNLVTMHVIEAAKQISMGLTKSGTRKKLNINRQFIEYAFLACAEENTFNPIKDFLNDLVWDRVSRIEELVHLLGCADTALNRAILKKWFVSAVARGFVPGTKVDTVLMLVGKQGIRKSSFFRELAGEWFSDTTMNIHDKDSFMAMSSAWIVEWAELESMRGKESTQLKSFLSSSTDKYRRPYQRNVETVPRSAIIVGTTNNKEFLTDDTGNRRYWVLECNAKKIETIMHIRDQLWAEAVHLYKEGYPYHFEEEDLIAELEKQQEAHVVTDDWFEPVEAYVRTLSHTSIYEVLTEGLGLTADAAAGWKGRRIAKILKDLGWELKRTDKARRWVSPTAGTSSEKPPKGRGVFGTDAN